MFSRFLLGTRALLSQRPTPTASIPESATTQAQIQAELAEAALEGMVTTRRQSHVFLEADLKDGSERELPPAYTKKRKPAGSADATPRDSSAKRRRKSSASGTIVVSTPVKAKGTRKPTSASKHFDKSSDRTLKSDSHGRNGGKTKSAANVEAPSVEQGCDTKGPAAAASKTSADYVGDCTHKAQHAVAVVIESKPVDYENMEDGASSNQTSFRKEGRLRGDPPVDLAAIVGPVNIAANTSIASSRKSHKKYAGDELDRLPVEQSDAELPSPIDMLKQQAHLRKDSIDSPKTSQRVFEGKRSGSVPGQQLEKAASSRASNRAVGASIMGVSAGVPKATHKRFASEEPETSSVLQPNVLEHSKPHNEDDDASVFVEDSDDDAPETLTASASLKQVRATAIEAARAVEKYDVLNIFYFY